MNKIITIGREFGSGGRELGRRLAEELGIAYYDREIIAEIAKRTELSEQYVQQIVEHRPLNLMPITIGHSICPRSASAYGAEPGNLLSAGTDFDGNERKIRLCACRPLRGLHFKR